MQNQPTSSIYIYIYPLQCLQKAKKHDAIAAYRVPKRNPILHGVHGRLRDALPSNVQHQYGSRLCLTAVLLGAGLGVRLRWMLLQCWVQLLRGRREWRTLPRRRCSAVNPDDSIWRARRQALRMQARLLHESRRLLGMRGWKSAVGREVPRQRVPRPNNNRQRKPEYLHGT